MSHAALLHAASLSPHLHAEALASPSGHHDQGVFPLDRMRNNFSLGAPERGVAPVPSQLCEDARLAVALIRLKEALHREGPFHSEARWIERIELSLASRAAGGSILVISKRGYCLRYLEMSQLAAPGRFDPPYTPPFPLCRLLLQWREREQRVGLLIERVCTTLFQCSQSPLAAHPPPAPVASSSLGSKMINGPYRRPLSPLE